LVVGLGEEIAAEIFRHLSASEAKRIAVAMSRLKQVNPADVATVMDEFHGILQKKPSAHLTNGAEFTRRALGRAFPGKAGEEWGDVIQGANTQLDAVELTDGNTLAAVMQEESPQTIALVLAFCEPPKAGELLRALPATMIVDVLLRLARLEAVASETISELNDHLKNEINNLKMRSKLKLGGADKVAAILNNLGKDAPKSILAQLAERHAPLAHEVEQQLFTFADLSKLDPGTMRQVLKQVPPQTLRLALRNASDQVAQAVYRAMSERSAALLREDVVGQGPQRLRDVEDAQKQIIATVRELEAQGLINLTAADQFV
jgi:flagellar motor switch protein FliG